METFIAINSRNRHHTDAIICGFCNRTQDYQEWHKGTGYQSQKQCPPSAWINTESSTSQTYAQSLAKWWQPDLSLQCWGTKEWRGYENHWDLKILSLFVCWTRLWNEEWHKESALFVSKLRKGLVRQKHFAWPFYDLIGLFLLSLKEPVRGTVLFWLRFGDSFPLGEE